MRIVNAAGRLMLEVAPGRGIDVERASNGRFGADVSHLYDRWDELVSWVRHELPDVPTIEIVAEEIGPPSPRPRQVFAVGLNYRQHASEAGLDLPTAPVIFTKFPSSVTGPCGVINLPRGPIDYEVELVAVVGRIASRVRAERALGHLAGLTIGQDLSDRELQIAGPAPQQFNLAKSFPRFSPTGPALVTLDEFDDPNDIAIECEVNGEQVQSARTGDMIFSLSEIVEYLSSIVTLFPGDLIFTGTPSGVGWARSPRLLLGDGDTLVTTAAGIGQMRHSFQTAALATTSL